MNSQEIASKFFPGIVSATYDPFSASAEEQQERANALDKQYGPDFDIRKLMDEAEDPLTGTLRDLKIDDRDLPLAKNFYDYIYNLSSPNLPKPWARQMYAALRTFGEICPYCSNRKWLSIHNIPKDYPTKEFPENLQLLEHGVCPKCKRNKYELAQLGKVHPYTESVFAWGQRSGKSTTVVGMSCYHTHRFLKFPRFSSLTGAIGSATPLTFTFISLTLGKAISVLWEPFLGFIEECTWHSQYRELMDYFGKKYGKELYVVKKEFIKFHYKKLHLAPSHPDRGILRGETRFGAAMDELGLFRLPANEEEEDDGKQANADEAHTSLDNSLLTIRTAANQFLKRGLHHAPTGMMFNCSSVISERDKIMRLLKDSRGPEGRKKIYGSQLATWDINPVIDRDSPEMLMRFERNYEKTMRDFGSVPPKVANSFIGRSIIEDGVFVGGKNTHLVQYSYEDNETGGTIRRVANSGPASLMSLDAGEVDNSFAITVFYFDFKTGKIHCSTALELIPMEGKRINHDRMYLNIIKPLAEQTNTAFVVADRWNSLAILQRLRTELKIKVQQITPRRRDFDAVLKGLEDKTIVAPNTEIPMDQLFSDNISNYRTYFVNKPVAHLAYQMSTVQDMGPGRSPDKAHGLTDDLFRSFALGASKITHEKIQDVLQKAAKNQSRGTAPRPVYVGRSVWMR